VASSAAAVLLALALQAPQPVRVGVYLDADEATAREMAAGADEAVAELGAARVALVTRTAAMRWGGNANDVAALVYAEHAVALVAPPDPRAAHMAVMVATRARVPVTVLSSDPRLTRNGVPWVDRIVPEDGELAALLLAAAPIGPGGPLALLIEAGGSGEATRDAVLAAAAAAHVAIGPIVVTSAEGAVDPVALASALAKAPALLLFAGAHADRAVMATSTAPAELPWFSRALLVRRPGEPARLRFAATAAASDAAATNEAPPPVSLARAGARAAVLALVNGRTVGVGPAVRAAVWEWSEGKRLRQLRADESRPAQEAAANLEAKQGGTP
jgi:hypothetical protein